MFIYKIILFDLRCTAEDCQTIVQVETSSHLGRYADSAYDSGDSRG